MGTVALSLINQPLRALKDSTTIGNTGIATLRISNAIFRNTSPGAPPFVEWLNSGLTPINTRLVYSYIALERYGPAVPNTIVVDDLSVNPLV